MNVTSFGILFAPLCLLCVWRPERLLQLVLVGASFDAAAVVTIGDYGVPPPLAAASFFIAFFVMQALLGFEFVGRSEAWPIVAPFLLFTLWAVICSYVLPRLFAGQVEVWPQKPQTLVGVEALAPSAANLTQDFYLIAACLTLSFSSLFFAQRRLDPTPFVNTYFLSGVMSASLAFWQLASRVGHLPYPEAFLRSNPGWALLTQNLGGVPRISGAFTEPAALASYMSGILGATGWMILKGHRGQARCCGF